MLIDKRRIPDTHVLVLLSHHQVHMRTLRYDIHTDSKRFIIIPVHSFYTALSMFKPRSHRANSAKAFLEKWKNTLAPFHETPFTLGHRLWSLLTIQKFWDAQKMAVRKGHFSTPAKLTTALTATKQSLASLDASSWTLGSARPHR